MLEGYQREELREQQWKQYNKNTSFIINLFLKNGFKKKLDGTRQPSADAIYKTNVDKYLAIVNHFWDYLFEQHRHLVSVTFIQFVHTHTGAFKSDKKGVSWCLIALYAPLDLERIFDAIFKDQDFMLSCYNMDSFIWREDAKSIVYQCLKSIRQKQEGLEPLSEITIKFKEYLMENQARYKEGFIESNPYFMTEEQK